MAPHFRRTKPCRKLDVDFLLVFYGHVGAMLCSSRLWELARMRCSVHAQQGSLDGI